MMDSLAKYNTGHLCERDLVYKTLNGAGKFNIVTTYKISCFNCSSLPIASSKKVTRSTGIFIHFLPLARLTSRYSSICS